MYDHIKIYADYSLRRFQMFVRSVAAAPNLCDGPMETIPYRVDQADKAEAYSRMELDVLKAAMKSGIAANSYDIYRRTFDERRRTIDERLN